MKSILFSATDEADEADIKEGRARPSEVITRRVRALMATAGAKAEEFAAYVDVVHQDDPDLARAYIAENGQA